ncbi:hypothetical protein ZWY2020_055147 [Hordeum vulgare]|nr:hypothetical protein ZWY2020_055147 [Hordeum vulgare]
MGPANLLFIILAAAAQLLSEAQWLAEYPTANLSTTWTNSKDSLHEYTFNDGSTARSIVVLSPLAYYRPYFGAGFFCASPCNAFLFAVYIFYADSETAIPHVVWCANRAHPVREGATVELKVDGNLVLRDADGSLVWSSGSSGRSVAGMVITKDCNLVLFDRRNGAVWQSFDHPSDVLLPGQSLLEGMRLVANTSATDWTENQVYMTVLPRGSDGFTGLYGYVGSTPSQLYLEFSAWMSENATANGPTKVTFLDGSLSLLVQTGQPGNPSMYNISLPAANSIQYVRLESDGHLRLYEWSQHKRTCTLLSDVTKMGKLSDDCAFPMVCGEYGICTAGQCTCPFEDNSSSTNYFEPVNRRKAILGCVPLNPISCQEMQHHKLLTLADVSYFDESHKIENVTNGDSCKQACLKDCSCRAVIFRYGLNDSKGDCLWVTKVFSLRSIQPETVSFHSSAYLKVQSSPSSAASHPVANKRKVLILGIALALVTTIIFIAIVVTVCLLRRRKYEDNDEDLQFDKLPGMPTRFPFDKLRECTDGFSKKLGEGVGAPSRRQDHLSSDQAPFTRLCFRRTSSTMVPVSLFFLILATAAPSFSAAQGFGYPTANLSTLWVNNDASLPLSMHYKGGLAVRPILLRSQSTHYGQSFAIGFFCAPPCDMFYFAVFIVQTDGGARIIDGNPQVVWSANRARPVRENATIELTSDGELVLRDADGSLVWSTGRSGRPVAGMVITNIGNLVLFDLMNATVWQSFDHPTDTLVPGQSLVEGMRLRASTSPTNWTENQLYVSVGRDGLYAYVSSAPPQLYYALTSNEDKTGNEITKVTFMNNSLCIFLNSTYKDPNSISWPTTTSSQFIRLDSDGHLKIHEWDMAEETWPAVEEVTNTNFGDCGFPTVCGEYGICTGRKCTCPLQDKNSLGYFKPIDDPEGSLGCTPLTPISCQAMQQHQLLTLDEVSYFGSNYLVVNVTTPDDCKQACLKNCSYRAVNFRRYSDQTKGPFYCWWVNKVFSMQSIKLEPVNYKSTVFIKVQLGPSNSAAASACSADNNNLILGTTIPAIVAVVLLAVVVTIYLQRRRAYYDKKEEDFNFDHFARMPARFSFQKLRECTQRLTDLMWMSALWRWLKA